MIARYFADVGVSKKEVLLGIGDDCALLQTDQPLAISTDTLISGVHFPENASASAIAYKALAVSLSDLAAMAATPVAYTLNLALPHLDADWLKDFRNSLRLLSETFGLRLIGGDSTKSPIPMLTVTIFGHCPTPWRRDQAQVGDSIWVTGTLGDAALGLILALQKSNTWQEVAEEKEMKKAVWQLPKKDQQYLLQRLHYPRPRIPLALALAADVQAGIDLSDGFLADLGHILTASQCAAAVFVERLPLSLAYQHVQKNLSAKEPLKAPFAAYVKALTGGDDYELCFTAHPDATEKIINIAKALGVRCTAVGQITAGAGVQLYYQQQPLVLPKVLGFTHW